MKWGVRVRICVGGGFAALLIWLDNLAVLTRKKIGRSDTGLSILVILVVLVPL
jgi:hypothetical protein